MTQQVATNDSKPAFDVIVIGGGLAGLVASVRATELGLRPLVLEQGDGDDYPCNSRQSGGILHIGFHDPFRPASELNDIIARMTDGEACPALAAALANTGSRLITWLQEKGARFMRFNQLEGYRWCLAPPRALRAGIDWQNRGPDVVMRLLAKRLVAHGGVLKLRTRVTSLIMESGACVGVRGDCDGKELNWLAPYCLIADGGFQSNRELFERNIGPDFTAVFQRGARTGKGAGLTMAIAAGASTTATNRFYGHLLCRDALSNDKVWPYPELDAIATAGIVVNEMGERIADEGRTGVYIANALAGFSAASRFHVIFDHAIWEGPGRSARIPANPLLEEAGGTVYRAESLEQLASLINVEPEKLRTSVEAYNAALAAGTLDQLPVPRSERIKPFPIATGPLMAIAAMPGITYSMGGIATDEHAQVLDRNNTPIPGLFAAGATTGGLEGGENAVYIGGLIKSGAFGMIAAERVASLLKKPAPVEQGKRPDLSSPSPDARRGLARYPALSTIVQHGKTAAIVGAVLTACLVGWLLWPSFGLAAMAPAMLVGGGVGFVLLSYAELVQLITDLLIPN